MRPHARLSVIGGGGRFNPVNRSGVEPRPSRCGTSPADSGVSHRLGMRSIPPQPTIELVSPSCSYAMGLTMAA